MNTFSYKLVRKGDFYEAQGSGAPLLKLLLILGAQPP